MSKPSAIARAVEAASSQAELARRLDLDYQRVHRWLKRGWATPKYATDIERATGVSALDLLADADVVVVPAEGTKKKRGN